MVVGPSLATTTLDGARSLILRVISATARPQTGNPAESVSFFSGTVLHDLVYRAEKDHSALFFGLFPDGASVT